MPTSLSENRSGDLRSGVSAGSETRAEQEPETRAELGAEQEQGPWVGSKFRRGYSLTEVVVATAIVGLLIVAALRTLAQGTAGQMFNGRRAQALLLANDLLSEIVELPYEDPNGSPSFGPETGETGSGTRSAFDDLDDYNGWSETPPKNKAGTALANASGFTRSVAISRLDPDNLAAVAGSESGVKRISVTVSGNGVQGVSQTAVVAKR